MESLSDSEDSRVGLVETAEPYPVHPPAIEPVLNVRAEPDPSPEIGICEGCNKPMVEAEARITSADGKIYHEECYDS